MPDGQMMPTIPSVRGKGRFDVIPLNEAGHKMNWPDATLNGAMQSLWLRTETLEKFASVVSDVLRTVVGAELEHSDPSHITSMADLRRTVETVQSSIVERDKALAGKDSTIAQQNMTINSLRHQIAGLKATASQQDSLFVTKNVTKSPSEPNSLFDESPPSTRAAGTGSDSVTDVWNGGAAENSLEDVRDVRASKKRSSEAEVGASPSPKRHRVQDIWSTTPSQRQGTMSLSSSAQGAMAIQSGSTSQRENTEARPQSTPKPRNRPIAQPFLTPARVNMRQSTSGSPGAKKGIAQPIRKDSAHLETNRTPTSAPDPAHSTSAMRSIFDPERPVSAKEKSVPETSKLTLREYPESRARKNI